MRRLTVSLLFAGLLIGCAENSKKEPAPQPRDATGEVAHSDAEAAGTKLDEKGQPPPPPPPDYRRGSGSVDQPRHSGGGRGRP